MELVIDLLLVTLTWIVLANHGQREGSSHFPVLWPFIGVISKYQIEAEGLVFPR